MTVVFLTTSFPRYAGDASGHFVATAALERLASGRDVAVIAPGRAPGSEIRDGVQIHWLGGERAFGWPGVAARVEQNPVRAGLDLLRVAAQLRAVRHAIAGADEIAAHWLVPCAWPLGALAPGVPLDAHAHGGDVRLLLALPAPARHAICARIVDRARSVRFASRSLLGALLAGLGADASLAEALADKSAVVPPPLDVPRRSMAARDRTRRELRVETQAPIAASIGRLVRDKRVDLAIAAVARTPAALWIIGDGPDRARLQALAAGLGDRVRFFGQLPRARCLELLSAADVLVHPSAVDAAPSAVREARALGIAVISAPVGDVPRWARADPGIRCVPPEPAVMADALCAVHSAG